MTQNLTRNDVIQYGLNNGYKARDINAALSKAGLGTFNPLTYGGNWQQLPGRLVEQGKELGRDLTTLGGALVGVGPYAMQGNTIQEKFLNAINSEPLRRTAAGVAAGAAAGRAIPKVGMIGGGLIGGASALLGGDKGPIEGGKNLVNALLSTYNTSIDDIKGGNVDWRDLAQGAMENPLYAGLDALSLGGAKAIGKVGKAIATKTGLEGLADFNRRLTNSKLMASQNTADIYRGYNTLVDMPLADRARLVEELTKGSSGLEGETLALANQLKTDLRTASDILADMGIFTKDYSRDNTIAQYVMGNIRDESNLLHKDIMDIIQGKQLRPTASKMFEDKKLGNKVLSLIDEGERLYDKGKTAFVSQKFANTVDPLGEVSARYLNLEENTVPNYARVIGRATEGEIGNVLEDTLKYQLDRSANMKSALEVFSDVVNDDWAKLGLTPEDKSKYITAFRDSLKKDIAQGNQPDFLRALNNSGIDTVMKDAGKSTLYKSLEGFFTPGKDDAFHRFSKKFKKNVLGIPSWSVGNRLGNWSLNAIEGVEDLDYLDIGKYDKYMPEALKLQTSYNSYLGLGSELMGSNAKVPKFRSIRKTATEFKKSYGRYKNSDRTMMDKLKYIGDTLGDIGDITSGPIFELEAKMEYMDRAANYIRQAKRYAKAHKMDVADVLQKSKTDKNLFHELNNKVQKSLGDYYGRNYAMPADMSDAMNQLIPFYRFPVQTVRTAAHGIANNPARFASNITIPARGGNVLSEKYIRDYNLNRDEYEGGVPYKIDDGAVRTMGLMPATPGIVLPRLVDPEKFAGMLNPLMSGNIKDILKYQKDYGGKEKKTPTSPRYTATKLYNPLAAQDYKPTAGERLGLALNEILGTTYNPYIWATRIAPQLNALGTGQGMQSFYNTMQPLRYKVDNNGRKIYEFEKGFDSVKSPVRIQLQNPEAYKKTTPLELLGGQIGVSTRSNYPKKISRSDLKKAKNTAKYAKKNIEKNR